MDCNGYYQILITFWSKLHFKPHNLSMTRHQS